MALPDPVAAQNWVLRTLGRRGVALLLFGTLWMAQAVTIALDLGVVKHGTPGLWHVNQPMWVRGLTWVIAGAFAITAAWPRWRNAHRWQKWGFLALAVPVLIRAGSYGGAWVASWFGDGGFPPGASSALTWLSVFAFIRLIAGWPEPTPPRRGR